MHPYPHTYRATAAGASTGLVAVTSPNLPEINTAPPAQFDGPGDVWSPETLLVAAVANCYILTFRALARFAKLEWRMLECGVEGILERVEGVTQFSRYTTRATLVVATGTDREKASQLLQKAERSCLVSNSLRGVRNLEVEIRAE